MFIVFFRTEYRTAQISSFVKKCDAIKYANGLISSGDITVEDADRGCQVVFSIKSNMVDQLTYNRLIQEKIDAARKDKNPEAIVYYSQKFGLTFCEGFNTFEQKPEFDSWTRKYEYDIIRAQISLIEDNKKRREMLLLTAGEADAQRKNA